VVLGKPSSSPAIGGAGPRSDARTRDQVAERGGREPASSARASGASASSRLVVAAVATAL